MCSISYIWDGLSCSLHVGKNMVLQSPLDYDFRYISSLPILYYILLITLFILVLLVEFIMLFIKLLISDWHLLFTLERCIRYFQTNKMLNENLWAAYFYGGCDWFIEWCTKKTHEKGLNVLFIAFNGLFHLIHT